MPGIAPPHPARSLLFRGALALAMVATCLWAADVVAQQRGGGGGGGGWQRGGGGHGAGGRWQGSGSGWHGRGQAHHPGRWHGSGWHGGWHGSRPGWHGGWHGSGWHGGWRGHPVRWGGAWPGYWNRWHGGWWGPGWGWGPGWAAGWGPGWGWGWGWGVGVGLGVTHPWWGWGWGPGVVIVERPPPSVIEQPRVFTQPERGSASPPPFRWYCPAPPGYHPDVAECSQGWLRVLPDEAPPGPVPSSRGPFEEPLRSGGQFVTASPRARIPAPRMAPPAQLARGGPAPQLAASSEP
jgi:hypothetical protein